MSIYSLLTDPLAYAYLFGSALVVGVITYTLLRAVIWIVVSLFQLRDRTIK